MRHYRFGSTDYSSSTKNNDGEIDHLTKPLIVVMNNENEMNNRHWCRSNKFKILALLLILLLIVQYIFGASIYNIRIFDYNIAQIYIWNDANSDSAKKNNIDQQQETTTAKEMFTETIPNESTMTTIRMSSTDNRSTELKTTVGGIILNNSPSLNGTIKLINSTIKNLNTTTINTSQGIISGKNISNTLSSALLNNSLPLCPLLPPVLVGPIRVWFDYPSYEELDKLYPDLEPGGHGKPTECLSRHKVAIVIPYRDRDTQLRGFLHNMHSLLRKQQLDYTIFAVEQIANQTFNRAKLMNVGFVEAMKQYDWQCVIFHDVDLYPEDDRNIYSCPEQPRHMSVAIDKFNYRLPYNDIFGGISALTSEQFRTLNGFSNDYWGWGGEDDDMASRVKLHKYQITRYPGQISRYKMVKHVTEKDNPVNACRYNLMYKVNNRWRKDGLSNLNYKIVTLEKRHLFTRLLVDLLETESRKRLDNEKICAKTG